MKSPAIKEASHWQLLPGEAVVGQPFEHSIDEDSPHLKPAFPNLYGSIVAVDGDPLKDSKVFGKVVFVMKDGVVYKQQAFY